MGNGAYTQEGVMFQILVAFGQGTGATRVSQEAAVALRDLYFNAITNEIVITRWEKEGGQALERVRALGRLAAFKALQRGDSKITADDVTSAAPTVHTTSDTEFCPPRP